MSPPQGARRSTPRESRCGAGFCGVGFAKPPGQRGAGELGARRLRPPPPPPPPRARCRMRPPCREAAGARGQTRPPVLPGLRGLPVGRARPKNAAGHPGLSLPKMLGWILVSAPKCCGAPWAQPPQNAEVVPGFSPPKCCGAPCVQLLQNTAVCPGLSPSKCWGACWAQPPKMLLGTLGSAPQKAGCTLGSAHPKR